MATVPDAPGTPTFSDELPTTLTVSWAAPSSDGGKPITDYILRKWEGHDSSGDHTDNHGNSRVRHLTGLTPGAAYTFKAIAINAIGQSAESPGATEEMLPGCHIRVGGEWKLAVPHVRVGGEWKLATPHVRTGGVWKQTG